MTYARVDAIIMRLISRTWDFGVPLLGNRNHGLACVFE
jgi:hypothetical protein